MIKIFHLQTNSTKWSNDNFLLEDTEDGRKRIKSFSLMTEVPENRTCEMAGIPDSFCSCHQIKEMDMEANLTDIVKGENTDMKDARNAAVALVQEINQVLKKHFDICFKWELKKLLKVRKKVKRDQFMIHIETSAAGHKGINDSFTAMFQGWVTKVKHEFKIKMEDVSRLNRYGLTAECISKRAYNLKEYCRCKV